MDLMKTEYEFLDLSDVKEADLKGLQCALFNQKTEVSTTTLNGYTPASAESGVSAVGVDMSSVAEVGGEVGVRGAPPAYGPPPPPYGAPPPPWVPPPNVYVSQVTANVNVHGYMGQYCPQPQQYPPATRPPRRDRRVKRPASPPPQVAPQPPPYYVQYPGYYGGGSAAGAPLYHLPMYQPVVYPPYYHPYLGAGGGEYPADEEEEPEPEYYPQYYPPPHEHPAEYYLPAAAPAPPPHLHHAPPHPPAPPTTHHFNVHAKNFVLPNHVQGQGQTQPAAHHNQIQVHTPVQPHHMQTQIPTHNKPQIVSEKQVEQKTTPTASATAPVDALPMRELKIATKPQTSPKKPSTPDNTASPTASNQSKPSPVTSEKSSPTPIKMETKPAWTAPDHKTPDVPVNALIQPVKTFTTTPPAVVSAPTVTTAKIAQPVAKISKGPAAPFSGNAANKPTVKPPTTQIGVSVQPPATTPKPPFSNRQRKDAPTRSPPSEPAAPSSSKPPFGPARRSTASPPPPAPWEFPPPPAPRNRPAAPSPPVSSPPAPGKSWASLFQKPPAAAPPPPPSPGPAPRPVAKVPPYDASPVVPVEDPVKAAPPLHTPDPGDSTPLPPPQPSPFADDPNSYRMGEFLSKYQLDNRAVSLLPRGLTNRSNYCYVNAILQALIACPPLYNMLKALPYQTRRGKSSTPVIDAMVELCYEFTVVGGRGGRGASSLPVVAGAALDGAAGLRVLRALTFPGAAEGRQEDAEEFLGCLLNGLNDEMLELMKLVEPEDKETQQNGVIETPPEEDDDDDDEWKVMGPRNKGAIERRWAAGRTPLSDIFRGRTRCRLHRAQAHDVTDAVQPFFTLQLDIERANNVKDALELLAGKDTLEGVTDAWQQLSLEQLPVVLLLHLKCFQLDSEGHTAKIVKNVDFPIDLKIDPKIMSSKAKYTTKQRMYKLFAVVYHEGVEAVKGHYLTDTFHGQAGWIRYDDSTVTLVNDGQVLKPKPPRMPYILMYRRQDTLPIPHRPVPKTD